MKHFGTDGIRGKWQEIKSQAYPLGVVLAERYRKIAVARDTRTSSFDIEKELVRGLLSGGADVLLAGVMPTPTLAHIAREHMADCAVMITASHNPPEYNGLKVMGAGGKLSEDDEQALDIALDLWQRCKVQAGGHAEILGGAVREYKRHIQGVFSHLDLTELDRPVYIDTAHGCFSYIAKDVLETLGADVVALNNDYDGERVNVCCGATAIENLLSQMPDRAVGFGFDGDGDRVIAILDGKVFDGDQILYNLATYYKGKSRGISGVVGTIMTGGGVEKALARQKIKLFRADVGDKHVAEMMREKGAILGGERSGHIIVGDKTATGDGLVTALAFLECYMAGNVKKVREYRTVNCGIDVENPKETFASPAFQEKISKFVSKIGSRGRVIVRPSGTEKVIRITIEAYDSRLDCEKLLSEFFFCKNLQKTK